jgi:hypothetical protein
MQSYILAGFVPIINLAVRVARWHIFKPTWVKFGGPWNEKIGTLYGHLEYITAIWYILLPFGNLAFCYILLPFGNLVGFWCIPPPCAILCREISGNPGQDDQIGRTFASWATLHLR